VFAPLVSWDGDGEKCLKYQRRTPNVEHSTTRVADRVTTDVLTDAGYPMRSCGHGLNIGPLVGDTLGSSGGRAFNQAEVVDLHQPNRRVHLGNGMAGWA